MRANNLKLKLSDFVYPLPVTSIASDMRSLGSIYELDRISLFLLKHLFGQGPLSIDYSFGSTTHAVDTSITTKVMIKGELLKMVAAVRVLLVQKVEIGSLRYLVSCLMQEHTHVSVAILMWPFNQ